MCRKLVNKTVFQGILKLNLMPSFSSVADSIKKNKEED